MSYETWRKEFYPITAAQAAKKGKIAAIEHSLQKWKGLTKANLKKHSTSPSHEDWHLFICSSSCALCKKYLNWRLDEICIDCPLFHALGKIECDYGDGPFWQFDELNNPKPMITALTKTLKLAKEGKV